MAQAGVDIAGKAPARIMNAPSPASPAGPVPEDPESTAPDFGPDFDPTTLGPDMPVEEQPERRLDALGGGGPQLPVGAVHGGRHDRLWPADRPV